MVLVDAAKHRRGHKEAAGQLATESLTAFEELGFLFADLDVAQHRRKLLFVDDRADVDTGRKAVADLELSGTLDDLFPEAGGDAAHHDGA